MYSEKESEKLGRSLVGVKRQRGKGVVRRENVCQDFKKEWEDAYKRAVPKEHERRREKTD